MQKKLLGLLVVLLALATYFFLPESCPEAARRCAGIFIFAAGFWACNIMPVYVTSLIVVLLLSFTLSKPGGVLNLGEKGYTIFLAPFSSPVLMLFFGGFILAEAFRKNGCDLYLASKTLSRFSQSPMRYLFAVMAITAFLSMWISNTAATVIMLGIIRPIYTLPELNDSFRKGLLLSIPFSANIGGIATPIGSPPNALAMGFLSDYEIFLSFPIWMMLCFPLLLILLFLMFLIMERLYVKDKQTGPLFTASPNPLSKDGKMTLAVAAFTIALWLSSPLHGIPEALTALLCAGALSVLGLIDRDNIKRIDWDILILMWGGLALGVGMEKTELGNWLVSYLIPDWQGITKVILFATLALCLSLFISNTAAAALLIPIALEAIPDNRLLAAVTIALMCSTAMIFPISTPPNALTYGTGQIENREMVQTGTLITICCYLTIMLGFWWIIPLAL
jgi:solute carrier family 13 (sodium-dependent dicarboxylate transporter), member 2/3/5